MARITFEGNFCDISMCRENPCPYNGMCSQRQTWERLKEYEDTGFDPEEIADFMKRWEQTVEIGGMLKKYCIDHIRDLLHAEQDGRLVVLPCGTDVDLVRDGHAFKADHWNHTLTAFRDAPENKSGKQVALFSIEEAEAALSGKDIAALDAPDESAEPEWKSKVMRTFLGGRGT